MVRPRAADDFAAIRARMEELRRERQPRMESDEHPQPTRQGADRTRTSKLQLDMLRLRRRL